MSNATVPTVTKAPRDRVTVSLRGLAPALKAHAKARHLSVSDAARLAVAAALEISAIEPDAQDSDVHEVAADPHVKLTIRLRRTVATRLKTRARTCGLSQGSYLSTLIEGATAPSLAMVAALSASTDQLAAISIDMGQVVRYLARHPQPPIDGLGVFTQQIVDGVRRHLDLASRVAAECRPARALPAKPHGPLASTQQSR